MNKSLDDAIIVEQLSLEAIVIINISDKFREELETIGFVKTDQRYVKSVKIEDQTERTKLIQQLIDIGALFQYGREWSPSEMVKYYRDDLKLVTGSFNELSWKNKNDYIVLRR